MTGPNKKLISAVETYFTDMGRVHASGGGTGERSYYPALANLLCAVGDTLKPKVFCVLEGADQGAGHPDYALYTAKQVQKGRPREGQVPERGVVEVKGVEDDACVTASDRRSSHHLDDFVDHDLRLLHELKHRKQKLPLPLQELPDRALVRPIPCLVRSLHRGGSVLGFLPTRAYRPGTPGATTFLSPLSGTFNYGWDSFRIACSRVNADSSNSLLGGRLVR